MNQEACPRNNKHTYCVTSITKKQLIILAFYIKVNLINGTKYIHVIHYTLHNFWIRNSHIKLLVFAKVLTPNLYSLFVYSWVRF